MESEESASSRGAFLRRAGVTLAAAIGVLAIPARAKALYGRCCPSSNCPDCTNLIRYYCDCGAFDSYCTCHYGTSCYQAPC